LKVAEMLAKHSEIAEELLTC